MKKTKKDIHRDVAAKMFDRYTKGVNPNHIERFLGIIQEAAVGLGAKAFVCGIAFEEDKEMTRVAFLSHGGFLHTLGLIHLTERSIVDHHEKKAIKVREHEGTEKEGKK